MAWRGVHLTRPAQLSLADGQMVVAQDEGEVRLALEDIAWVVIDTPRATVTTALLSACMGAGVALIACDAAHTPCGVMLPFHQHHKQAQVAATQVGISLPLKKRLWQAMVQAKVANQAAALELCTGKAGALPAMVARIGSGDPDNVEARAARYYWPRLLDGFVRGAPDDRRNKLLNYGYAVIRACVARSLVASGLLPCFGVNHASVSNAFNLADDVVEPFRPFVDQLVWSLSDRGRQKEGEITIEERRALAGVLFANAEQGGGMVNLLVACDLAAASLVRAMEANSAAALSLPRLRVALL